MKNDNNDLNIPIYWLFISVPFGFFSKRSTCIVFSFLLLVAGYVLDCYFSKKLYLIPFASLVVFLGLLLTIRNHYLSNLNCLVKMASSQDGSESVAGETVEWHLRNNPKYRQCVISKANDEGIGIVIILIGTIFNAFGSFIPLLKISL